MYPCISVHGLNVRPEIDCNFKFFNFWSIFKMTDHSAQCNEHTWLSQVMHAAVLIFGEGFGLNFWPKIDCTFNFKFLDDFRND